MTRTFIFLFVLTSLLTTFVVKAVKPIADNKLESHLIITDSKTNQTIQLIDKVKLQRFNYFWSQKQPIKKSHSYHWQYQLLIKDNNGESKWVYDPKGFAREVTLNQTASIYQVTSARSLNRFLQGEY